MESVRKAQDGYIRLGYKEKMCLFTHLVGDLYTRCLRGTSYKTDTFCWTVGVPYLGAPLHFLYSVIDIP